MNIFRGNKLIAQLAYTKNQADHWNTFTPKAFSSNGIDCARPSFVKKGAPAVVGSPYFYNEKSLMDQMMSSPKKCPPMPPAPAWLQAATPAKCTKGCVGWPVPITWPKGSIKITELYSGSGDAGKFSEDWVELTNFGKVSVSTAGWWYDDDSKDPTKNVPVCGPGKSCPAIVIKPGESIIIVIEAEKEVAPFRKAWKVPSKVKIGYADGSGLGGNGDAGYFFNSNMKIGTSPAGSNIKSAIIAHKAYGSNDFHGNKKGGHAYTFAHSVALNKFVFSNHPTQKCAYTIPKALKGLDHRGSPGKVC